MTDLTDTLSSLNRTSFKPSVTGGESTRSGRRNTPVQFNALNEQSFGELVSAINIHKPGLSLPSAEGAALLVDKHYLRSMAEKFKKMDPFSEDNLSISIERFVERVYRSQEQYSSLLNDYKTAGQQFDLAVGQFENACLSFSEHFSSQTSNDTVEAMSASDNSLQLAEAELQDKSESVAERLRSTLSLAADAADNADRCLRNLETSGNVNPKIILDSHVHQEHVNSLGAFIGLIMTYMQQINESNLQDIKLRGKFVELTNNARLAEYQTKATEAANKNEAAKKSNRDMTICTAIFGIIAAIVGVVAAIPTGGASVMGVVGFVATVVISLVELADVVLSFTSDLSLMGKVQEGLSWLIEHTITEIIAANLEADDVDPEKVKEFRKYFTMVLSTIAYIGILVAPMICAGLGTGVKTATETVGKTASKAATTAVEASAESVGAAAKAATRTAGAVASETAQAVSQGSSAATAAAVQAVEAANEATSATTQLTKLQRFKKIMTGTSMASGTVSTGLRSGTNILSGINTQDSYYSLAALGINEQDIALMGRLRKEQVDQMKTHSQAFESLTSAMSDIIENRYQALKSGYRNMSRHGKA